MLSNSPAAEALTVRKPTPASHTPDAKVQTSGQSFFDVFTSDSRAQSHEKIEHIADSAPTGSEAPEVSEANVPKSEAPKFAATIETSKSHTPVSSEMRVTRDQGNGETESLPTPYTPTARDVEDVPVSGSDKVRGPDTNSNPDVPKPVDTSQKSAKKFVQPAALTPAAQLSEQVIRTHMAESQPRAQQILDKLALRQTSATSNPMDREANQAVPQIAVGHEKATPLKNSKETDTTKLPVLKGSTFGQPDPTESSTSHTGGSIAESPPHPGGFLHLNQHRSNASEVAISGSSNQLGQADLQSGEVRKTTKSAPPPAMPEEVALSAQEQVFLNTNRYGGSAKQTENSKAHAPDGTKQVIAAADATNQPIDQPVSATLVSPKSGSMGRSQQDASAGAQLIAKQPAIPKAGVLPAAAQPTVVFRSIASEPDIASTQAGQTTRPVHTPDIALQQQNISGDQKAPPVQFTSMQGTIPPTTKTGAPLSVNITVGLPDTTPSDEGIRPPAAGSQTPSPQARGPIPGEVYENQTRTQNLPIKPAKDTLTSAPHALARVDAESETPRATASSTILASQGTTKAAASPPNQTAKTASVPPIASLSNGVQASLVQHDPEVAIDEPMLEITRLTEQVSGVLAVSESPASSITRPEMIRSIAAQMATVVPRGTQAPVEIALNPEELGKVKMSVTTTESSVVMTIAAERPETLDLMRRNLEQLTSEFRELGYSDINFVFAGDGSGTSGDSGGSGENQSESSAEQEQVAHNETQAPSAASSGVDVRV